MTLRLLTPFVVALGAFAVAVSRPPGDSDMYWHLASGKWMLEHRDILRTDVFSSTVVGQPYSVGEWLGEVVLYLAYAIAGWPGIVLLRGLLVAVAGFFLARVALRSGARLAVAVPIVVAALVLSTIVWTDRPHLFTLALFPLLLDLLLAARDGRTRRLVLAPPLLLVWTDLHGGYALGLALIALFALEAVIRRQHAGAFVASLAFAAVATLLDPGSLGLGSAIGHAASPPRFIVEEAPPDVLNPAGALFALFVLGVLGVALRTGGSPLDALVLIPLLVLALSAQRDMPYFAFAAASYLARRLPDALPRITLPWPHVPRALPAGIVVGIGAFALTSLATLPSAPDESGYPTGAPAALRQGTGVLLNEYDWGGYLIWRAPERPVFIDGRLYPYLPSVFADWNEAVLLGPHWRDVLLRYKVSAVLLRPDRPLTGALREDGWHVVAGADRWVLLSRP